MDSRRHCHLPTGYVERVGHLFRILHRTKLSEAPAYLIYPKHSDLSNAVFNDGSLVATIMDHAKSLQDLLSIANTNHMTRAIFLKYYRSIIDRLLAHVHPFWRFKISALAVMRGKFKKSRQDPASIGGSMNSEVLHLPKTRKTPLNPVEKVRFIIALQMRIEKITKSVTWPSGPYVPHWRPVRFGGKLTFMHLLTNENRELQRYVAMDVEAAVWHLYCFNTIFPKDISSQHDRPKGSLSLQLKCIETLDKNMLWNVVMVFNWLRRKAATREDPRFFLLEQLLTISGQGFNAVLGKMWSRSLYHAWVQRHVAYQLSIALPLLLCALDPPKPMARLSNAKQGDLIKEAIALHKDRDQQRQILWGQEVYQWTKTTFKSPRWPNTELLRDICHGFEDRDIQAFS